MKDCFVQIIKSNGVTGLWRGNVANLLKVWYFTSQDSLPSLCL